ncbi:MAG: hypothetical protein ABSB81_02520 [Halobacteriota archaeon]
MNPIHHEVTSPGDMVNGTIVFQIPQDAQATTNQSTKRQSLCRMRLKKEVLIAVMSQHEKITAGAWPQEHQQDGVVATLNFGTHLANCE